MSKSLLLISELPEDQAFANAVAQAAGISLRVAQKTELARDHMAQADSLILLVNASTEGVYQRFETLVQDTVGIFSDKVNANHIHFLYSEDQADIGYLTKSPLMGHMILRNYGDPAIAGKHYGRLIKATLTDRAFGLQNYLGPKAKVQSVQLKSSLQKQDAVEAVKNYMIAAKFQVRMAASVSNAVDEILMNAIFDAPVDPLGKQLYASTPRSTEIALEGKSIVEMHIGFDGEYLAISASDQFGSLDRAKLLNHISKVYTQDEYKVRSSVAGAGIGLASVFRSGASLIFLSEAGVRTESIVIFRKTDHYREFKDQFRFLSTQFYY